MHKGSYDLSTKTSALADHFTTSLVLIDISPYGSGFYIVYTYVYVLSIHVDYFSPPNKNIYKGNDSLLDSTNILNTEKLLLVFKLA